MPTTFASPTGAIMIRAQMSQEARDYIDQTNQALKGFLNDAKQRQDRLNSCDIPERMKELLRPTVLNADAKEVSKFIWDSLTPDEQFTCLMAFPDEIKQLLGE